MAYLKVPYVWSPEKVDKPTEDLSRDKDSNTKPPKRKSCVLPYSLIGAKE